MLTGEIKAYLNEVIEDIQNNYLSEKLEKAINFWLSEFKMKEFLGKNIFFIIPARKNSKGFPFKPTLERLNVGNHGSQIGFKSVAIKEMSYRPNDRLKEK